MWQAEAGEPAIHGRGHLQVNRARGHMLLGDMRVAGWLNNSGWLTFLGRVPGLPHGLHVSKACTWNFESIRLGLGLFLTCSQALTVQFALVKTNV